MAGRKKANDSVGRELLLEKASALFAERGYAAVAIHEIAEAAGMTRAAPYYHFKDKEDLFVQVANRELIKLELGITERLEAAGSFRERLERMVEYLVESTRSTFGEFVADLDRHVSPERKRILQNERSSPTTKIHQFFVEGAAAGEYRRVNAETASSIFFALIMGQMELLRHEEEILGSSPIVAPACPQALVEVFLGGI